MPEDVLNSEQLEGSKNKGPFQNFLNQLDNTGELLEDASTVDEIKQQRCIRAEIMARSMDEARYLKFSKARNASFANKNRHKFSDWLSPDSESLNRNIYSMRKTSLESYASLNIFQVT